MKQRFFFLLVALSLTIAPTAVAKNPQRGLSVVSDSNAWGKYHALIIGINDYKEWPRLQTAVKDAKVIRDILVERYGFDKNDVILRTDRKASRNQINRDLRYLATSMGPSDNLLVYYAGHGQLDDLTGDGYWVPAEGKLKDPSTWVSNAYIKAVLSSEKVQAKNVIVIADSCYSGSMLRGGPSLMALDDRRYRQKLAQKAALRSRQVISSGGIEPVADGGADGHSLFAFYLIDALRKNEREVIDLENLFHTRVWKPVTEIGGQRPNVGRLKTPMDQDGQFVLYNASWARLQAQKRAALAAQVKKQENRTNQKTVAAAELELQRQRIEIEKQKLEYEKKQLAQQKALELERLKLERQKQEIEYAKMQARLEALEKKRKSAESSALLAAVDKRTTQGRPDIRDSYKLALFPIKCRSDWGHEYRYKNDVIRAIASISRDDNSLDFELSYKVGDGLSDGAKLFSDDANFGENQAWMKASFFSEYEPNWEQIKTAGIKTGMDLAVLVFLEIGTSSKARLYLYDYRHQKTYTQTNCSLTYNDVSSGMAICLNRIMKEYRRSQ